MCDTVSTRLSGVLLLQHLRTSPVCGPSAVCERVDARERLLAPHRVGRTEAYVFVARPGRLRADRVRGLFGGGGALRNLGTIS